MAAAAIIAAGAITQGVGAIRESRGEAQAAEFNADVAGQNAILARQQAAEEERRVRIQSRKSLGEARAGYGASGVTLEGSPLDVLEESAANAELDALTVRHQGRVKEASFRSQESLYRAQAKSARVGGYLSAASALLSGGGKIAGRA